MAQKKISKHQLSEMKYIKSMVKRTTYVTRMFQLHTIHLIMEIALYLIVIVRLLICKSLNNAVK